MESKAIYRATEHDEQVAVFEWAELMAERYPALNLLYAVPNGARTSMSVAKRLKAEGLRRGVPDICLPVSSHYDEYDQTYHALYIEMKRPGGKVS